MSTATVPPVGSAEYEAWASEQTAMNCMDAADLPPVVDSQTWIGSDKVTITASVNQLGVRWRDPEGLLHHPDGPAAEFPDGEEMWCKHGMLHRDGDLPAHTDRFGVRSWFRDGKRHRDSGPAVEGPAGPWRRSEFWVDGLLHNPDGPAIHSTGSVEYFVDGVRHRDDGPALERADGHREWWLDGVRHRSDGPAVTGTLGQVEWWLDGVRYPDVAAYREAGGVPPEQPVVRQLEPEPEPRVRRRKTA